MSTPTPSHLNQGSFKKMLAGRSSYLPKKIEKSLKNQGLDHLLHQPRVSKDQAVQALNALKKDKLAPRPLTATATYAAAAKQQAVEGQAVIDAKRLKRARAAIRYDLAKEQLEYDQQNQSILEEERQRTHDRQHQGEITRIEREADHRQAYKNRLTPSRTAKGIDPKRPTLMEPPDLAIG